MDVRLEVHCSTHRCKSVMSDGDDVYCSQCMEAKNDEINSQSQILANKEKEIERLELVVDTLKEIIAGCEDCSAKLAARQL